MPRLKRAVYKRDKNFTTEAVGAMRLLGGYHKDPKFPHHYANCQGLRVALYDTNKMGSGYPDAELWVSWLCIGLEVKQERPRVSPEGTPGRHTDVMTDAEYYRKQLEETELLFRMRHPSLVAIVWDRYQIVELANKMAEFVLYVEGKNQTSRAFIDLLFPKVEFTEKGERRFVEVPKPVI